VAGMLVHHFGPAIFFPVSGILLTIVVLAALTQKAIREFGATPAAQPAPALPATGPATPRPGPEPSS